MKISFKKIVYILVSLLLIVLLIYISNRFSPQDISTFIAKAGPLAPVLYVLIQIIGQIFAPLSTSALFVAGFIIFGKNAIFYSVLTWLISSITNFYLARKFGKKVLKRFIGEEGIIRIEEIAERIDTKRFYLLRFSTFYINDFASYAFGLTRIPFFKYYMATVISMIPWSIVMMLVMKNGEHILLTTLKIFLTMIPFAFLSYLFLKKKRK
ncbi:TVP38/TMEM64 family protein [Candidatus Dojkabacteria bacterium]|nr:TVP38/TMEM64 family protein [Candidatus Dojkabacteria bacterium]